MHAKAKQSGTSGATVPELEAELAEAEAALLAAQRQNVSDRGALPGLIAMADSAAIAECRARIKATAAEIKQLGDDITTLGEAVDAAKRRDLGSMNSGRLRVLERLAAQMVATSEAAEEATATWAAARAAAVQAASEYEGELMRCRVTFDAFVSVATRLDARLELLLWLDSEGTYGRARTLETPHQLRSSGRASLRLAAAEFRAVSLRSARQTLGSPTGEVSDGN